MNYSNNPKDIFQSAKNFLYKLNTKQDSSKTAITKVRSKIFHRKKTSKQQCNFCKAKISVGVHDM